MAANLEHTAHRPDESASQRVVRAVMRGLYEGDFAPGQRLAEPELMQQFGVSRSTARESIRRMESEGLVEVLPHKGAVIRRLSLEQALDALLVMEACIALAARLAAQRIGDENNKARLLGVWENLQQFRDSVGGYDLIRARNRFYRTLTDISGNRELQRILPTIHIHLVRREYSLAPEMRFEDYRRMVEAVLSGNPDKAEQAARAHMARTADVIRASART